MSKKVLITGASGLLGREILKQFVSNGWDALGLAYSRIYGSLRKVDLCDESQIEAVLDEFTPAVVVHSAAERRPDVVDKQSKSATALNVGATEKLASLCANRNIFLLYISSDYVFDGNNPPYMPDAHYQSIKHLWTNETRWRNCCEKITNSLAFLEFLFCMEVWKRLARVLLQHCFRLSWIQASRPR